jgi:hypothetical protein
MEIAGEQSPKDFSFSVKTQTKSAFEILVLAQEGRAPLFQGSFVGHKKWFRGSSVSSGR